MSSLQGDLNTFRVQRRPPSSSGNSSSTAAVDEQPPAPETESPADQDVDLQALAKKVYDLFKKELRIEQDRLGRAG